MLYKKEISGQVYFKIAKECAETHFPFCRTMHDSGYKYQVLTTRSINICFRNIWTDFKVEYATLKLIEAANDPVDVG